MPLPTDDLGWVTHLASRHDRELPQLQELNALYEGSAPLHYIHPEILREVGDRLQAVSLGWPMLAVDPLEERLDVLGFRYPEDDDEPDPDTPADELASATADKNLQRVWQDNDLDEEAQLGRLDALVMRRSYIAVGTNEDDDDTPLVTVESPLEMYADIDPRTRAPRAALRRWVEDPDSLIRLPQEYATLYMPNHTVWFDRGPQGWRETGRDVHNVGEVLVTPLTNRGRLADRYGKSELTIPLLSLSHAANKLASDMMVAAEFHAIPLRALFGIGPDDLVDDRGEKQSALQVIMGKLLSLEGSGGEDVEGGGIKAHEFQASSLANFHQSLTQLAKHATALVGLPPTAFGVVTDTPASAEAWRAAEARLIKRAERKTVPFSGSYKRVNRHVRRLQDGDWDPATKRLETIWRDPSTPTRAQAADAVRKVFGGDEPIITKRQAREDLGYSQGQIRRMQAEDAADADRDPVREIINLGMGGQPAPVEPPTPTVPAPQPEPAGVG
ncbi:Phage portal protein, SPP1 Gp6-like [Micromonospora sediminicola]|uniref:Phage portal protein, SPP1 Gp6-like n=1 Tax=Micromonospora sediminicola TaxID=946078 RepID=A0A1A9B5P5_9ACTN|nr:phage portal protein [Micromonospora sediminicola]SBT64232.1 Phage portal protein, SPP1 Gp6-like [Micromonospora sediminicola]